MDAHADPPASHTHTHPHTYREEQLVRCKGSTGSRQLLAASAATSQPPEIIPLQVHLLSGANPPMTAESLCN